MTLEQLLPLAQSLINNNVIKTFKEQGAKVAFTKIYTFLPVAIRLFIKEEAFINFCLKHQDKLIGNKEHVKNTSTDKTRIKKAVTKKNVVKKVVKKAAAKNIIAKKTVAKKK